MTPKNKVLIASLAAGAVTGLAASACYMLGAGALLNLGVTLATFATTTITARKITGQRVNFLPFAGAYLLASSPGVYLGVTSEIAKKKAAAPIAVTQEFNGACKGASLEMPADGQSLTVHAPGGCVVNIAPQ